MDSTPFTRRPLHEAKALRRAYGDEKYGTALRTGVSWPVEAYIECVDIDNYLDFAYAASEIDEGMFWEMHAHLGALMHLLKGAARE